jgi:hypothetical protein
MDSFILDSRRKAQDQFRIAEYRNIRVVGRKEKLALLLLVLHRGYDAVRDEAVVEVILGLVLRQRSVRLKGLALDDSRPHKTVLISLDGTTLVAVRFPYPRGRS